jgi:O-antigen/teichoic acid export membrane protein/chemotaxis methyl-accepting protein methylase
MGEGPSPYHAFARPTVRDLKQKSVRGGFVTVCAQGVRFILQTATVMLLARLLSPEDFGLQGMVVALTGFLALFRDAGLGTATVQRLEVTQEQTSTLFWINAAVGAALAMCTVALAPVLVSFYHEPRLYWIAVASGAAFMFNGLAAQHQALLMRGMRFVTLAKIDVLSLIVSSAVGIIMAFLGWRYWALVGMAIVNSLVSAAGAWLAVPWVPGFPRRKSGVLSMLRFGWLATCNSLVVFLAWNSEKILLGRFWGADALGLYGRAYQLVTLPVQQLNSSMGNVAFPALSRIQDDAGRLTRSFLRGYSLLVSLTIPITISCALFAEEIVRIVLGAKWMGAAPVFRLLAPTALVFAVANPLSWLVLSMGRAGRALTLSLMTTPFVLVGIVLGLSHGPKGVALGYSSALSLLVIPIAAWSKRDTGITWTDLWRATKPPFLSGLLATAAGLIVKTTLAGRLEPITYLFAGLCLVFGTYTWALLIAMGQRELYMDLLAQVFRRGGRDGQESMMPSEAPPDDISTRLRKENMGLPVSNGEKYLTCAQLFAPNHEDCIPGDSKESADRALPEPSNQNSVKLNGGGTLVSMLPSANMPETVLERVCQTRFFREYLARPYLPGGAWIWSHLPASLTSCHPLRAYGVHLHSLIQARATRKQSVGTFFFRNRPELELLLRLLDQNYRDSSLNLAVVACSTGAEVYSISYAVRSARPDLKVRLRALDIDRDVLEFAQGGVYPLGSRDVSVAPSPRPRNQDLDLVTNTANSQRRSIFERMSLEEIESMFDRDRDRLRVKPRFRDGITWHIGDAADPDIVHALGLQDIVVANRFLCHMPAEQAGACLRNLARLVKPGGYVFVSGVDLDVRSKVAQELGWRPVTDLIREIHEGDPSLRRDWPLEYWGLEPFDQSRADWKARYASVFQCAGAL